MDELNSIVELQLDSSNLLSSLDQRKDYVISFIENMDILNAEVVTSVFQNIMQKVCLFCFYHFF